MIRAIQWVEISLIFIMTKVVFLAQLAYSDFKSLPTRLQNIGRNRYLWFTRFNTISFGCLADSILILYAIKNGADDLLVGIIVSFLYFTMPLMIIGKELIAKIGAARTYGYSWLMRNLSAAIMVLTPFATVNFSRVAGLALLTLSTFSFFAFRSVGFTANTPLLGEVTAANNRGNFISKVWLNFNLFCLLTLTALMFVLKSSESITVFQGIIIVGVSAGLLSSLILFKIPETPNPRLSGQVPLKKSFSLLWNNNRSRKLIYGWSAASACIMLIIPFSMVAIKNGYGISDHNALMFAIIQLIGGIVVSLMNVLILDRVGPRPMLIIYSFGLIINCLLWLVSPTEYVFWYPAVIFLINGICTAGIHTTLSHYFLTITSNSERVGSNMFLSIISGVVAGAAGAFIGGGLLKISRNFIVADMSVYRGYFGLIFIFSIPLFLVIKQIERIGDWKIRDVLGIFISFRDIRALFTLHRLE
ncbi:MAG TPA: MFS transporter [bacterium]|nr:MFS transporter [bacterium]